MAADNSGTAIVAITRNGAQLASRLHHRLVGSHLYLPSKFAPDHQPSAPLQEARVAGSRMPASPLPLGVPNSPLSLGEGEGEGVPSSSAYIFHGPITALVRNLFPAYSSLVLFMALGAAVRLLSPLLKDKRTDPAVVVVDELGRFAISCLSGHIGGANLLANRVARLLGAQPIITTASDALGIISPDLVGAGLGWTVENSENFTKASAALVNGESVGLFQDAGEQHWYPAGRAWPANLRVFDDLDALAQSSCSAAMLITDRVLGEDYADLWFMSVLYRPKSLVLGIGCNRGTTKSEIEAAVLDTLREHDLSPQCIRNLATIDLKGKEEGLVAFASEYSLPLELFSPEELNAVPDVPNPSEITYRAIGAIGVCEPAAMLSAQTNDLLVAKTKMANVTVAVARVDNYPLSLSQKGEGEGSPSAPGPSIHPSCSGTPSPSPSPRGRGDKKAHGNIFVIGIGPGAKEHMTFRAAEALAASHVVVGYKTYIDLLGNLLDGKQVIVSGMRQEVARAKKAVELANDARNVSVVSSGDAGVYGMAGLVYDVARANGWTEMHHIEVVPGVSSLNAVAALLGAPLMHDFAVISLSDLLTPWAAIARRLEAAARGDFVVVLYNPRSGRRTRQIEEARDILLSCRREATPVGIVTSAFRDGQRVVVTDLEHMLDCEIGMLTTIIVGNSTTTSFDGVMVTPRGYDKKYELGAQGSDDS
ncbi:MAG: precorrin-3B C(17)-methyltransferase [Chloroflexi bacterium]|nr:precorrin-3B C(17)-methyltransferase [Chloroflexota bacterium]